MIIGSVETSNKKRPTAGRNQLNKRLPRVGRVLFSPDSSPVHCSVKNFTDEQATLTMSGWMGLPSAFTLYIEPDSIRAACRVLSRKGSNIQVEFTEVEEGVRYRSQSI
jgi:hypothetical protein